LSREEAGLWLTGAALPGEDRDDFDGFRRVTGFDNPTGIQSTDDTELGELIAC
jgi:hypothetical protein